MEDLPENIARSDAVRKAKRFIGETMYQELTPLPEVSVFNINLKILFTGKSKAT